LKSFFHSSCLKAGAVNDLNDLANSAADVKVKYGDFMLSDEYFFQRGQTNYRVVFKSGKLLDEISGREALYIHFYRVKQNSHFRIEKPCDGASLKQLIITPQVISCSP